MDNISKITLENIEISRFFLAIVLLLFLSHIVGYVFNYFKMPRVVGEITSGIILGPSILGYFIPSLYKWIFSAFESEGKLLSGIYWLGLVFLMFISGFEIQRSFTKEDKKIVAGLLLGATIIPFIAGWMLPNYYDFTPYIGVKNNILAMKLVIAIAIGITSIPVISKIFLDLNIIYTRFAKIVLAAATVHDIVLWVALAIATGLVSGKTISKSGILSTVMITTLFFLIMLSIMPKLIIWLTESKSNILIKSSIEGYVLFLCLLFATIASILNINIVFGAFLAGIIIGNIKNRKFQRVKLYIKKFSFAFFIPIYFSIVGIKIDLIHHFDLLFFIEFLAFTTCFEIIGTYLAMKILKLDNLSSMNFAIAMNAKGGPGIVLATIAFDMGIINETFFVSLVLTAILTSLLAGSWFSQILSRGKPLMKDKY